MTNLQIPAKEKLIMKQGTKVETFTDAYSIDCHAITASGYIETVTFGPFKKKADEAYLYDLVATLNRMETSFREGNFDPIQSDYENVEGYLGWFDSEHKDAESFYAEYPDASCGYTIYAAIADTARQFGGTVLKWPMEPLTNYETPAKYHGYDVFYSDLNGIKHRSPVEFEG